MQLYNSLSGQKEPLHTLHPGELNLYVCGVTVYDLCHIGHARTNAVFDVFVRYLRYTGMKVNYVRNITDIEDKIIKRASERGISTEALVAENIQEMYQDFDAVGLLRPDHEPRATETLPEMLEMISRLVEEGFAYVGENQDVYYEVAKFKAYGKLSKQNLEALQAGHRVQVSEAKKSPLDFVLWKAAKPGEPAWPSPWGPGRPGWHIECSAMTRKCLGAHFDVHGGGSDLRFPHHENEIAQSEAANHEPFARYWMHSGMVQVDQEKMSKSLGNFFTIREVLAHYPAEVIRYFLIAAHYRSEINYSAENLEAARASLTRLYRALQQHPNSTVTAVVPEGAAYEARFSAALADDLNTPEAMAVLFELAHLVQRHAGDALAQSYATVLKRLGAVLGLLQQDPAAFVKGDVSAPEAAEIEEVIAARLAARQAKNFAEADRIRDTLKARGIELEDGKDGTSWRVI